MTDFYSERSDGFEPAGTAYQVQPARRLKRGNMTFERTTGRRKLERIEQVLKDGPLTAPEIAARIHSELHWVHTTYLRHLMNEGRVHIQSWTHEPILGMRAFPRPQYALGPGQNAPKPPLKTYTEINRDYRNRILSDPDARPEAYRKMKAKRIIAKARWRAKRAAQLAAAGYVCADGMQLMTGFVIIGKTPTPAQLSEIIRLRESGMYWKDVAAQVGVSQSTAQRYYARVSGK